MENVKIVVFSRYKKIANEMKNAIDKEAIYFKANTKVVTRFEDLEKNRYIDLLVILLKNTQSNSIKDKIEKSMSGKIKKIVIIDLEKKVMESEGKVEVIARNTDIRALGFSIVYDYYCQQLK